MPTHMYDFGHLWTNMANVSDGQCLRTRELPPQPSSRHTRSLLWLFLFLLRPNVLLPTAAMLHPRFACIALMLIIKLEVLNVTTCNCCQHIPESSPVWMIGLLSDLDPARAQQRPEEFTRCRVSLLELDQGTSDTSFMAWHKCKMSILTTASWRRYLIGKSRDNQIRYQQITKSINKQILPSNRTLTVRTHVSFLLPLLQRPNSPSE